MTRRKSKLTLNPKKRTRDRLESKKLKLKCNIMKHVLDTDQIINEGVTIIYWSRKKHSVPFCAKVGS